MGFEAWFPLHTILNCNSFPLFCDRLHIFTGVKPLKTLNFILLHWGQLFQGSYLSRKIEGPLLTGYSETRQCLVSRFILLFGEAGGGMSRYCCITAYVFSSCIRRFSDELIVCTKYETRNLACIVGFHMTSHYVVAQRSQSIDW